jgi:hypothetical protein
MPCYLVRAGDTDKVKIGFAVDVANRVAELQAAHWERLNILRIWEGDRLTEAWLHRQFPESRIARDWFFFDPDMLSIDASGMQRVVRLPDRVLLSPGQIEVRAKSAGLIVTALCRRAGVAQSTFTRWKNGTTEPTLDVYRRLRDAAAQVAA